VDVSRALGVPPERVPEYLLKGIGAQLQEGERLAEPRGLSRVFKRGCAAPVSGQIVDIRNGMVVIEAVTPTFKLHARYPGQVIEVLPGRGAIISTAGALIQGVWGSGGEAVGVLEVLTRNRDQQLHAAQIGPGCSGSVVVAGRIVAGEGLEEASQAMVSGMIVGGVDSSLRQKLCGLPYPVLIVEGFGAPALSEEAFRLLQSSVGREAVLIADNPGRHEPGRAEVLIPANEEGDAPLGKSGSLPLQVGMRVRGLRAPYRGVMGTVVSIPPQPQTVESGLRVPVVDVELAADGRRVHIPQANLERVN
jgi:hypothetical protein